MSSYVLCSLFGFVLVVVFVILYSMYTDMSEDLRESARYLDEEDSL